MSSLDWSRIRAVLFDLDGVLYVGDRLIPGAVETISYLKSKDISCCFTTNTTSRSLETLHYELRTLNLPIERHEIFSAPLGAVRYLRQIGDPSCYLVLADDAKQDFAEFRVSETRPDVVVIGDIAEAWDYAIMNRLFNLVLAGAEMVAIHKGRYWQTAEGLRLDSGAFVAGLEYASGKEAIVVGKPSRSFFESALARVRQPPEVAAMVGDDIVNDVGGAQSVGMAGVLVRTGKYRRELVASVEITPDATIDSVADLMNLL